MASTPVVVKFTTKRHSQRPYLRLRVQDTDGVPFDFTGAAGVVFVMWTKGEEPVETVSAPGVIVDPPESGILEYQWDVADLDTAGEYLAEFDVDYGAGETMTLPGNGNILVTVFADVNDE